MYLTIYPAKLVIYLQICNFLFSISFIYIRIPFGDIIDLLTIFHLLLTNHLGMLRKGSFTNVSHRSRNFYRLKRGTTIERLLSNTRHAIRDSNRSQTKAVRKRPISNTRHAIRDSNRSQTCAKTERPISNTRHAVGDSNRSQTWATSERPISNTRYAVGDNSTITTLNKCI